MRDNLLIYTGRVCPYCHAATEETDSATIYGAEFADANGNWKMLACMPCGAWVSTHRATGIAMGRLADQKLRQWKQAAHAQFNKLYENRLINRIMPEFIPGLANRQKAYRWLSQQLGIPEGMTHIGYFDITLCKMTIKVCVEAMRAIGIDEPDMAIYELVKDASLMDTHEQERVWAQEIT
jgi:glutaredoxin